jgi:hypothetical protein
MDKGTASNILSAVAFGTGYVLDRNGVPGGALLLSAGLFAFSGGITNSLAVKMLFDRIPGLYGSGVILERFEEIRAAIKRIILENFFGEEVLRRFLASQAADVDWTKYLVVGGKSSGGTSGAGAVRTTPDSGATPGSLPKSASSTLSASGAAMGAPTEPAASPVRRFIESNWDRFASPESLRPVIGAQIDKLFSSPMGALLQMAGRSTIENLVSGFVQSFATDIKVRVLEAGDKFSIDPKSLGLGIDLDALASDLRAKVDVLLEDRLREMRPEDVKQMMEDVIRDHLGWLVVWGNVFGAVLGVAAYLLSID